MVNDPQPILSHAAYPPPQPDPEYVYWSGLDEDSMTTHFPKEQHE